MWAVTDLEMVNRLLQVHKISRVVFAFGEFKKLRNLTSHILGRRRKIDHSCKLFSRGRHEHVKCCQIHLQSWPGLVRPVVIPRPCYLVFPPTTLFFTEFAIGCNWSRHFRHFFCLRFELLVDHPA